MKNYNKSSCDICKNYSKCYICSDCNEGSEFEAFIKKEILTEEQFEAITTWTAATKIDMVLDICRYTNEKGEHECSFWDFEEDCEISFMDGLNIVYDAIAYPLIHDISEKEAVNMFDVLVKYGLCDEKDKEDITGIETKEQFILLNDLSEGCTDAVIITETSTAKDIEEAIQKAKDKKEYDWQFEDLIEALPEDCRIITKWSGKLQVATY